MVMSDPLSLDLKKSNVLTSTTNPRLPCLHRRSLPVVESKLSWEGGLYEFTIHVSENTPLVVASPEFQMKLSAEPGKTPGPHLYDLLLAIVHAGELYRQTNDSQLGLFLKEAKEYGEKWVEMAENTIKFGTGLYSVLQVDGHRWVNYFSWLMLRYTPVVIHDKRNNGKAFKGVLYHVIWEKDDIILEGIRDDDDETGNRLYKDVFGFTYVSCGDVYILKQEQLKV